MKKIYVFLSLLVFVTLACNLSSTAMPPTPLPPDAVLPTNATPLAVPATTTPEIFIARTQAVPGHIQLSGVALVVMDASLGACDLPDCPAAPTGRRYLRVSLQAMDLPADQTVDYKNLPQGIAVRDELGVVTPYGNLYAYTPATQQLALYFTVPEASTGFSLIWPGVPEIPLTVAVVTLATPTALPPVAADTEITFAPLSFVLPAAVGSGASGSEQPRVDSTDAAWWQKTPGHLQVSLGEYYTLQGKSHQPQIYVFPALAYAELVPAAFESLHRLNNFLYDPAAMSGVDQLPAAPFFNDKPMFAAHVQMITFQNGSGVRFVTQSGQSAAQANNRELFYHFEGMTSDGVYYIVAIFPITAPVLAETGEAGAALPPGGIPYPELGDPSADFAGYYAAVTALLNATSPQSFTPAIAELDALIQSFLIVP